MKLCLITPTRQRYWWLLEQVKATAPQLRSDDHWIIIIDNDAVDPEAIGEIHGRLGTRLILLDLSYDRKFPPVGCVNRAHNAAVEMIPGLDYGILEVDDHDILMPGAIDRFRAALDDGADYVFGDFSQQAIIQMPGGTSLLETWPDSRREYKLGGFMRGEIDGLGPRAFTLATWRMAGGWWPEKWPGGDMHFAREVEFHNGKIVHISELLAMVTIDGNSLMAEYRGVAPPQE